VRSPLFRLSAIVALSGVGLAAAGVALMPAAKYLQSAASSTEGIIDLGPLDQRSYVYAADGSLLATLRADVDRQPVPLSAIPDHTVDAVLAVEDADFYQHDGLNLRATLRALVANVDSGETVQGGSTITQQVVKNEIVGSERSIDRKAREAVLARRLEESMSKDEILERYLNTVYLGNGAYGIQAGAETYYGVSAGELDIAQSAFLAGMIANPSAFDPIRRPEAARERRDLALRRLQSYGRLTDDEVEALRQVPLPQQVNQVLPLPNTYFVEEVKQQLLDDERLGETEEERYYAVFRGGLRIYTTLDPRAQLMATKARDDVLGELAPAGTPPAIVPIAPNPVTGEERVATGAVVSVEPRTGAIRAMVGGAGFQPHGHAIPGQAQLRREPSRIRDAEAQLRLAPDVGIESGLNAVSRRQHESAGQHPVAVVRRDPVQASAALARPRLPLDGQLFGKEPELAFDEFLPLHLDRLAGAPHDLAFHDPLPVGHDEHRPLDRLRRHRFARNRLDDLIAKLPDGCVSRTDARAG